MPDGAGCCPQSPLCKRAAAPTDGPAAVSAGHGGWASGEQEVPAKGFCEARLRNAGRPCVKQPAKLP